jgi:hypothetical protein
VPVDAKPKTPEKVIEPIRMTDWKRTKLRARLNEGKGKADFTSGKDNHYYREEDIDYMINLLKFNHLGRKESHSQTVLQPIFQKTLATLSRLMSDDELCLLPIFDKLQASLLSQPHTTPLISDQVLKLLLRCRLMFDCRGQLVRILQIIDLREERLRDLNLFVVSPYSEDSKAQRESELKERVADLAKMTESLVTRVRELLSKHPRLFGYTFVYDNMDYC